MTVFNGVDDLYRIGGRNGTIELFNYIQNRVRISYAITQELYVIRTYIVELTNLGSDGAGADDIPTTCP